MLSCTDAFKSRFMEFGRQFDITVTVGGTNYTGDSIVSVSPSFEGEMLTAVMRCLEIELLGVKSVADGAATSATIRVKNGAAWESLNLSGYMVYQQEYDEGSGTLHLTCYDKMLLAMVDYDLTPSFPITIRDLLSAICTRLGYTLSGSSWPNSSKSITTDLFTGMGYTFRDVLTQIAQTAGRTIVVTGTVLQLRALTDSGYSITPSDLRGITIGECFGPVNSIVLARTPQEDNVYLQDAESISANGLHELRIEDNQIMDGDRSGYLPALLAELDGLEFETGELDTFGIPWLDVADGFLCEDLDGNDHYLAVFQNGCSIGKGCSGSLSIVFPSVTKTDYRMAASSADRAARRTELKVDKQAGEITAVAERVTDTEEAITILTETAEGLEASVTKVTGKLDNIGGRNLIINTLNAAVTPIDGRPMLLGQTANTVVSGGAAVDKEHGIGVEAATGGSRPFIRFGSSTGGMNGLEAGKTYTLSADVAWNLMHGYTGSTAYGVYAGYATDASGSWVSSQSFRIGTIDPGQDQTGRCVFTFTVDEEATSAYLWVFPNSTTNEYYGVGDYLYLENIKLESGEVATAWSPAPEDLQNYAKEEASAQISVTARDIRAEVSNTLENYSTTTDMKTAINQSARDITATVSETYETKADAATVNLMPSIYYREAMSENPWVSTSGITWTVKPDGSIVATGTATAESAYSIANSAMSALVPPIKVDPTRDYTISGIPGVTGCRLYFVKHDASGAQIGSQGYIQNASSAVISAGADYISCFAYIVSGTALPEGGVTFRPQLEVGTTAHGYSSTHNGSYSMRSQIIQNAEGISSKVERSDYTGETIASLINQSADTVQIAAQHINLEGAVTISSFNSTTQAALLSNTAVKTQYYLSTSASSATGGTWYDSPNSLTWSKGKYVWTRTATTKTNASGTSTTAYSTAVYDKQLTTALSTAASAVTAAGNAQATANGTVTDAVPIYYRSMSSTTPTLVPGETYVYVTDNTDDQWSTVSPRPKKSAYFWEAVRYTLGDGSRAYSPVRALTSEQYASKWVSTADSAYIDGGSIYANSVTADKISVSDLNALNATIAGWTIGQNAIYKNVMDGTTRYQTGIYSPSASTGTLAFYVEKKEGDDTPTYPFAVRNNGHLTATDATITGSITATSLTLGSGVSVAASKVSGLSTVATSGNYSDLSGKPDLTVYIAKDGTVGSTPSEGAKGFKVANDGVLTASSAIIYGDIYASNGRIGGWSIEPARITKETEIGGITYRSYISAPSSPTANNRAFSIARIENGTTTYPFAVFYNGKVVATDAEISGKVTATSGNFSGWSIGATDFAKTSSVTAGTSSTQYQVYMQAPTSPSSTTNAFVVRHRTYDGSSYGSWTQDFVVTYGGKVTAKNASITGDITATSLTLSGSATLAASKVSGLASVATSGSYSDLSRKPDLTLYYKPGDKIGSASAPAAGVKYFKVGTDGLLQASNAVIYGTIYASNGEFTGTINSSSATITGGSFNVTAAKGTSKISLSDGDGNYSKLYTGSLDLKYVTNSEEGVTGGRLLLSGSGLNFYNASGTSKGAIDQNGAINGLTVTSLSNSNGNLSGTGNYVYSSVSSAKSISTAAATSATSVSLTAGIWVITGSGYFAANGSGIRKMSVTSGVSTSTGYVTTAPANSSMSTLMSVSAVMKLTATTTINLNVYQNSGSALNFSAARIDAVRIIT